MITKYNQFNESIKSLLVGPSSNEMTKYWKSLGFDRTFDTPEEFLSYMIDGMVIKIQTPKYISWEKNGKIDFEQDLEHNILWINYKSIWMILEKVFDLESGEIRHLIKNVVGFYINWSGFTPTCRTWR